MSRRLTVGDEVLRSLDQGLVSRWGEVLCNDVFEFGGTWVALDAKGNPPS